MDNFRRYRPTTGRNKTVDGFIRPQSGARRSPSHTNLRRGSAYQPDAPQRSRTIGDFNVPDGFHPVNRAKQRSLHENLATEQRRPRTPAATHQHIPKEEIKKQSSRKRRQPVKKQRFQRIRQLFFFNPFKRRNWTKGRAFANALVLLLLVGGFFGGRTWWLANQIFRGGGGAAALQENVDPSQLRGEGDGRVNILMLGRGGSGHDGPDLTDTIVIASINPIQKEAALLSIPRDLYVRSSNGGYTKINEVFANAKNRSLATSGLRGDEGKRAAEDAGLKAVEDMVRSKIGIPIHYHAIIDFAGFRKAIDTVGGIDINVTEETAVCESFISLNPGKHHLNGESALAFSRARKDRCSPGGDHSRSQRQRAVIMALKDKIFSAGTYGNPWKISQLMSDFGSHVRTNLGVDEVKRLYEIGNQIPSNKIASVDLVTAPNDHIVGAMLIGKSVQIPKAGIDDYSDVKHFVRNRLKDGFLAQENATVAIYNGTMIGGLAGRTATDLKSYGYKISVTKDAPKKGVQKTIVVALRSGEKKYTKRYLENRFGTQAVSRIPDPGIQPGNADFVIILGQNEQTRLAN